MAIKIFKSVQCPVCLAGVQVEVGAGSAKCPVCGTEFRP